MLSFGNIFGMLRIEYNLFPPKHLLIEALRQNNIEPLSDYGYGESYKGYYVFIKNELEIIYKYLIDNGIIGGEVYSDR